ncbi:uncharacterized protein LOC131613625 [Vicia villosa]|uniref:uncharacterized protein LOC131613625 n=1 Tax=Vicia villosa TaxID=3911 RepID=UPI00273AD1DF|nr:uncharacterized protein LOC131613625 [Vicia villosa]
MAFDSDLWDLLADGYSYQVDANGVKIARRAMTDDQKKAYKNHYKAESILLSAISLIDHEKITDKETANSIFDSLKMTHEGLKVLNKGYSTSDHVKKIIRSLPKNWRPMVTVLKMSKDLNNTSLEELMSSLRNHEIELQEDEPQRKRKFVALKSKSEKKKAFQAEEESEEKDSSEDEMSLLSKRLNQLWKHRKRKFQGSRRSKDISGLSSGQKRASGKEVICYECKEHGHYKYDCPKLDKDKKPKKALKTKKGLTTIWDESDSREENSDEEQANMVVMEEASTMKVISESELTTDNESNSDDEQEVLSSLSRSKLESRFSELMKRYHLLISKYKILKKSFVVTSEKPTEDDRDKSE